MSIQDPVDQTSGLKIRYEQLFETDQNRLERRLQAYLEGFPLSNAPFSEWIRICLKGSPDADTAFSRLRGLIQAFCVESGQSPDDDGVSSTWFRLCSWLGNDELTPSGCVMHLNALFDQPSIQRHAMIPEVGNE